MADRQYIRDYELLEEFDAKGHVKSSSHYIGDPWYFKAGPDVIRRRRKQLPLLAGIGWICYIGAMYPPSEAMRTLYVSLPFAASAVPLFLFSRLALRLLRAWEPMERWKAESFLDRYPPAALLLTLFPFFSLAGDLIRMLLRSTSEAGSAVPGIGDLIFPAGACALLLIGGYAFRVRKDLEPEIRR